MMKTSSKHLDVYKLMEIPNDREKSKKKKIKIIIILKKQKTIKIIANKKYHKESPRVVISKKNLIK